MGHGYMQDVINTATQGVGASCVPSSIPTKFQGEAMRYLILSFMSFWSCYFVGDALRVDPPLAEVDQCWDGTRITEAQRLDTFELCDLPARRQWIDL